MYNSKSLFLKLAIKQIWKGSQVLDSIPGTIWDYDKNEVNNCLLLWSFNLFVIFYFHFFFLLFFFKAASQVPLQSDWSVFSKIWERTTNIDLILATTLNSRTLQNKAVTWVGGFRYSYKSRSSSMYSVYFDILFSHISW